MIKILTGKYGDMQGYNVETNTLLPELELVHGVDMFFCQDDGQILTPTEVVNFTEGDFVIMVGVWDDGYKKTVYKPLVITDKAAKADFEELLKLRKDGNVKI